MRHHPAAKRQKKIQGKPGSQAYARLRFDGFPERGGDSLFIESTKFSVLVPPSPLSTASKPMFDQCLYEVVHTSVDKHHERFADDPGIGGTIVSEKWIRPTKLRKVRAAGRMSGEVHETWPGFEKLRHVECAGHVPQVFVPLRRKQPHPAIRPRRTGFFNSRQRAPEVISAGPVGVFDDRCLGRSAASATADAVSAKSASTGVSRKKAE